MNTDVVCVFFLINNNVQFSNQFPESPQEKKVDFLPHINAERLHFNPKIQDKLVIFTKNEPPTDCLGKLGAEKDGQHSYMRRKGIAIKHDLTVLFTFAPLHAI